LQADAARHPGAHIETSVVRFIRTRLEVTHEQEAICVIAGPWGIGKTTAVESFAKERADSCAIVKVERGSMKRGASPVLALQQTVEAIRPLIGRKARASLSNAYWSLRQMLYNHLEEWRSDRQSSRNLVDDLKFSIVFDEAQYLSREAIEMLRYWNDTDRTTSPFPIGLIFIGNSEFALEESNSGESALTGAVRSRALFVETLGYEDVSDDDILAYIHSCGAYDGDAAALVLAHFHHRRVRRDFRILSRLDAAFRRRSGGAPVSSGTVRSVLG